MKKSKLVNPIFLSILLSTSVNAMKIGIEDGEGITPAYKNIIKRAASKWEKIILNEDLPRAKDNDGYDIVISPKAINIDGIGNTLAQAGPTEVREDSYIPSKAILEFDSSDLDRMYRNGTLLNVATHEIAHALGFGVYWKELNLVNNNSRNPLFTGPNAKKAYQILRNSKTLAGVPLENFGGPGTASSHWSKKVFGNELMTGYASSGASPLSILTIAAFNDMGYTVDYDQYEPYSLPTSVVNTYQNNHRTLGIPYTGEIPIYSHFCQHKTVCPRDVYYCEIVSSEEQRREPYDDRGSCEIM